MAERLDEQLGKVRDRVSLKLGGETVKIATQYEVTNSIFTQPAAFSLTTGHAGIAREMLERYPNGTEFQLFVGPNVIMTGTIDAGDPSGISTEVSFQGRDYMAALFDGYVEDERSFKELSFLDLTTKVLELAGLGDRGLITDGDNTVNLKAVTGSRVVRTAPARPPDGTLEVQQQAQGGTQKVVYNTIKAELGNTWWSFLQAQYKLAGLFLWTTGSGSFILGSPDANKKAAYRILRRRGATRNESNVIRGRLKNDWSGRYARAVVHGRGGGGKFGRSKVRGEFVDEELTAAGVTKAIIERSDQAKTIKQCEFLARRRIAEQRRQGWQLKYTVSGHTTPGLLGDGFAVWAPDMVCEVHDDELGIEGLFYIAETTFRRDPATTTEITLMRPEDLVFAEKLYPDA